MKKQTIKYLRSDEVYELFDVIHLDQSRHAIRNKAIFSIAKYCALRVSEITYMEFTAYDPILQQIYCRREKGSNNNTIRIIDPDVIEALQQYLHIRSRLYPDSKYLFPSQKGSPISRKQLDFIMKKYCSTTSISDDKHHFHVLKHTRAVELGNSGADIKDIQWWLGHKNIDNTMIYMQYTTNQQEALYQKLKEAKRIEQESSLQHYLRR